MSTINGLPAHVLLVHAVVVFVPLSAALLLLSAFWPAARRKLGLITGAVAAVTLALVPITTEAGDWLEHHLPRTPLLRVHTHLGDDMLPWAAALFVVAAAVSGREFMRRRRAASGGAGGGPGAAAGPGHGTVDPDGIGGRPATVGLAVLALLVAVGSVVTCYQIGDSGARAAWTGNFSSTPVPSGSHPVGS